MGAEQVQDLFEWWTTELRAVARLGTRNASELNDAGTCLLRTEDVASECLPPETGGGAHVIGHSEAGAWENSAKRLVIVLNRNQLLTRRLSSQRLPRHQATMMAELDLLGATPFELSQVHIIFDASNDSGCSYHIVKRSTFAPVVHAVRNAGIAVSSLRLETSDGIKIADCHSLRAIFPLTKKERFQRSMWRLAVAILLATAFGTYAHALWRLEAADNQLGAQIAEAQAAAKQARIQLAQRQAALEQTSRLRDQKQTSASVVETWAELTKVLPDTAWVTDLTLRAGEVTVNGYAQSAAGLIEPLEASPLLVSPDFVAPVVRVPGQEGERFVIKAKVARQ
ncbi:PilN domain-containing protein [Mesorhizobium sp. CC13]|uniref:PilN domain-containing protein n=1 Tax=Mesorhizobium sp. CC13 TaxID=3029194 RepID=UPI0032664D38